MGVALNEPGDVGGTQLGEPDSTFTKAEAPKLADEWATLAQQTVLAQGERLMAKGRGAAEVPADEMSRIVAIAHIGSPGARSKRCRRMAGAQSCPAATEEEVVGFPPLARTRPQTAVHSPRWTQDPPPENDSV